MKVTDGSLVRADSGFLVLFTETTQIIDNSITIVVFYMCRRLIQISKRVLAEVQV